jgi:hypothetical protein
MKNLTLLLISLILCVALTGCKRYPKLVKASISTLCLRDSTALRVRILNRSNDTIYVPVQFIGTFRIGSDTVYLESKDSPRFGANTFYRYKESMPFEFYSSQVIENEPIDSIVRIFSQTNYHNQFGIGSFAAVPPNTYHHQDVKFDIPKRSSLVSMVYYHDDFNSLMKRKDSSYSLTDFEAFEKRSSYHAISKIIDIYY